MASAAARSLARHELFAGLPADALGALAERMRPRTFTAGEALCRAGEPGDALFLVLEGLARVSLPGAEERPVARLRRGDVIGEMALVTGEPRTATAVAAVPTTALELSRDDLAAVIGEHPQVLANLNRILSRKLAATTARVERPRTRGEAVALLAGESLGAVVPTLVAAAAAASPGSVSSLEAGPAPEGTIAMLDDALLEHRTVIVVAPPEPQLVGPLVDEVDRAVAVVSRGAELERVRACLPAGTLVEVVAAPEADERGRLLAAATPATPVVRWATREDGGLAGDDSAWVGRHLARTKLGLALGAGGAKGYAHVAMLHALESAGYVVDVVAGSSIGAIVGAWLAQGRSAAEVEATMREAWRPEAIADIFKLSLGGGSTGLDTMTRILRETTDDETFADLVVPLVVMTVDLDARRAAPVTDGPLWQALLAATALAGMFPPHERDGRRLVDGIALVPVPVDAAVEAGADVTVSVNIISRRTLPAWPGEQPPSEEPRGRSRMLDALLEVMDLAQLDASERHAARADVVVTPAFGPSSWRDFHLADLFLEAGREAAENGLEELRSLARPQLSATST
ncbi:MAG: cyclic nucleotide-binding domain-containing protein [Thermoleophilia bacterium]|nr:cyclic nucleotide-binding domain-containing protein [Thermoleophilia bacterium]